MSKFSRQFTLSSLIKEIINEVGDLGNIEPYPFSTMSDTYANFKTDDSEKVSVYFEDITDIMDKSSIPKVFDPKNNLIIQFVYDVQGSTSQYKKTSFGELIKILKTVLVFFKEKIPYIFSKYGKNVIIVISSQSRYSDTFNPNDPQKDALYQEVVIKNLPSGFRNQIVDISSLDGVSKRSILIQNIK